MLQGDPLSITPSQRIDLAEESPLLAGNFDGPPLRRLIVRPNDVVMQPPPGIDGGIGHTNLFDFFEIEEPFTIEQRMQSHDPRRRGMRI